MHNTSQCPRPRRAGATVVADLSRMKPDRNYYIGHVLPGGYRIQQFIGSGAFAYVYYATNEQNFGVAVKIQYNTAEDAQKRFVREIKVLQQLPKNDYCIEYFCDGNTQEGLPYLIMEFVDGATLKETLKYRPVWNTEEGCQFMVQLCDAFGGLHELGLAHRDVKPDNIMLTRDWRVKLMDLGLVKDAQGLLQLFESEDILQGRDFGENLDRGVLAGTPEYMAPEQFSDPSVEDEALALTDTMTDVYSLGLIFYELLTGEKLFPFKPDTSNQSEYARSLLDYLKDRTGQDDDNLMRPRDVPQALWTVLERALRADPKLRQRNAPELGENLQHFLDTGEGIAAQDEDKTSAIDLNVFLSMHGSPTASEKPPGPAASSGGQNKTLPLEPLDQATAERLIGEAKQQQGAPASAQTAPLSMQEMQQRAYGQGAQPGYPGQPNPYGQPVPYGNPMQYQQNTDPYMDEMQPAPGGSSTMILWIVLIVLILGGAGGLIWFILTAS